MAKNAASAVKDLYEDPYLTDPGKDGLTRDELTNVLKRKITDAEQWLTQKYLLNKWGYYYNMYLAKRSTTLGSSTWRSNIFIPIVQQIIMDTTPRLVKGMIGKGEFYTIKPKKVENYAVKQKSADALEELMKIEFETGNFKNSMGEATIWAETYGIGWIMADWRYEKERRQFYDIRKGKNVEVKREEVVWDQPYFRAPDPQNIFIDPSAREFEDMGYFAELQWLDVDELRKLKSSKAYDASAIQKFINEQLQERPQQSVQNSIADNTTGLNIAPINKYSLHTVYTKSGVYALLNMKELIRAHKSPYRNRRAFPLFPITYWKEPQKIIGRGVVELLADMQEAVNDMYNLKFDNSMLAVNKIFKIKKDSTIDDISLALEPGVFVEVENMDDLSLLDMGDVHQSGDKEVEQLTGFINRVVSTAPSITAQADGEPVNNTTATAASLLADSMATRFSTIVDNNITSCIQPLVRWLIDLNGQYMSKTNAVGMVGEITMKELGLEKKDFNFDEDFDYEVKGISGERGKAMELQLLLQGMQIFQSIPGANDRIDWTMVLETAVKDMEMPKNFLKKLLPQQQNPGNLSPQTMGVLEHISQLIGVPVPTLLQLLEKGKVTIEQLIQQAQAKEQSGGPQAPNVGAPSSPSAPSPQAYPESQKSTGVPGESPLEGPGAAEKP